jgi:hypothetical protein
MKLRVLCVAVIVNETLSKPIFQNITSPHFNAVRAFKSTELHLRKGMKKSCLNVWVYISTITAGHFTKQHKII